MNRADCYRILGLATTASFEQVKGAYRRLARQFHPDVNPGDRTAKERFIEISAAYRYLLEHTELRSREPARAAATNRTRQRVVIRRQPSAATTAPTSRPQPTPAPKVQINPKLSPLDQQLKENTYEQLQSLLRTHRFPRAIAIVEGLAKRLPDDPEVIQWQAITYQRWGRDLIRQREFEKARIYLKKALRTDPHNRSLWAEIETDFRRMERQF